MRRLLGIVLGVLLWAAPAQAAIVVGTVTSDDDCGNAASFTISSHTVDGGSGRYLIVIVPAFTGGSGSVTGITWNTSENLTQIGASASVNNYKLELWGLANPTATTADIVISNNNSWFICGGAISLTGVDTGGTPLGSFASATGTSTGPTVNCSSAAGELVVDGLTWASNSVTATAGADQTQRHSRADDASGISGKSSTEAGAGTTTMSWTLSSSVDWAIGCVPVKPAGGGGGGGGGRRLLLGVGR